MSTVCSPSEHGSTRGPSTNGRARVTAGGTRSARGRIADGSTLFDEPYQAPSRVGSPRVRMEARRSWWPGRCATGCSMTHLFTCPRDAAAQESLEVNGDQVRASQTLFLE